MSKTVVTEEFDNEGNLVKRTTSTETGDTYTPYFPGQGQWTNPSWYPYITNTDKIRLCG